MRLQVLVALQEMLVAKEAAIGTERTGMRAPEHQMARGVDEGCLAACGGAPQHEHEMLPVLAEQADDLVGEGLPPVSAMAEGLAGTHGEAGVEQEHTLAGPAAQIAALGDGGTGLGLYLLEDIAQRGREIHPVIHAEAKPMGLARAMIGVLAQDDHLDLAERRTVESIEDEMPWRIAGPRRVLFMNKADEFAKVGLGKLVAQYRFPGWLDIHICHVPMD